MNNMDKTDEGEKVSGSEIKELIQKLSWWSKEREQSQKWLENLLSSFNGTIDEDINNLTEEVGDLKSQLSVVTKERNDLKDTNKKLDNEIEQQRNKFAMFKNLLEMESQENKDEDNQEVDLRVGETPDSDLPEGETPDSDFPNDWNEFNLSVDDPEVNIKTELEAEPDSLIKNMDMVAESDLHTQEDLEQDEESLADNKDSINQNYSHEPSNAVVMPVIKISKGVLSRGINGDPKKTSEHFCQECGYFANDIVNLNLHLVSEHNMGGKKFKCEKCSFDTDFKLNLKKHAISKHGKRKHICSDCGSAFSQFIKLKYHYDKVHPRYRERLKCYGCPYTATVKQNLIVHIERMHEKIKNHKCQECGHAVYNKSDLRKHVKAVHANIRPHICDECGFATSRRFALNKHMESVHKMVQFYKIDDKILNKGDEDMHEKRLIRSDTYHLESPDEIHLREQGKLKPDQCEECGKVSYSKTDLKKHMIAMHNVGDRKFLCEQCSYTTYYEGDLERHIKYKHDRIKNHVCEQCGYASFERRALKKHIETIHKGEV